MADTKQLGLPAVDIDEPADDDQVFWSVTTIIGVIDKPGLLYWASEQAAVAAINQQSTWTGMLEDCDDGCPHDSAGDCQAVKWLRDARWRRPKNRLSNSDLGTVVHALAEEYALEGVRPDRDRIEHEIRQVGGAKVQVELEAPVAVQMLDQFDGWLQRFTPSYQATEVCVYSPTYGYAGTADTFLTVGGFRAITDYKTSRDGRDSRGKLKTPYADQVGLQLAAYRHADMAAVWRPRRHTKFRRRYYVLSGAEREMAVEVPEVDGGLAIMITPEHCEAFPIRCDEEVWRAFLHTQETFRWAKETSKTAMADPIVPPTQAVAS